MPIHDNISVSKIDFGWPCIRFVYRADSFSSLTPLSCSLADDEKLWTLSLAVASYISLYAVEWNKFMAADLVYMLPTLILFFTCQKYFMQGLGSLTSAGLK